SGDGNFNASASPNLTQIVNTGRVSAAGGGTLISADLASNGVAAAFTTLGNIVIAEQANNDFPVQTSRTLILTAPSGWRFNAGTGSAVRSGGTELTVNSFAVTTTNMMVTLTVSGTSQLSTLTIS